MYVFIVDNDDTLCVRIRDIPLHREGLFSACKHGASQKGPCVVMVFAQKVGGAHKNILYLTTELSYLVEQNIKTLHTEKERYTEDLLPTQLTCAILCCWLRTALFVSCFDI